MKKIFAFAVVAMLLLAIPAAAANYKLSGSFSGGYKYSNGAGTDSLSLALNLSFDEAGLLTAYAPLNLVGGIGVNKGWYAKFATEPLNVIISDNYYESASEYQWAGLEGTFKLLGVKASSSSAGDNFKLFGGLSDTDNRFSKVWGKVTPNLSYAAEAVVDDVEGDYAIAAQLGATLPLGLKLTSDFGWLYKDAAYGMGLATALTGKVPVIGGDFKVAVGNFADLEMLVAPDPEMLFWTADDLWAFAAYAGVTGPQVGPIKIDELSYKFGMPGIYDSLLYGSFYTKKLMETVLNVSSEIGPVAVALKNAVWFPANFATPLGGYNANLDVEAGFGGLTVGLNFDSKLNWLAYAPAIEWGWIAELRAEYEGAFGTVGGDVGYNSNWEGVGQYVISEADYAADKVYADLYFDAPFGLHVEAFGEYDQKGTNYANAGLYAKYENAFTNVPYVVDLKTLVAGRFGYYWDEGVPASDPDTHAFEAIGMLKLDTTVNGQWSGGLLFITRNNRSEDLSFKPIASIYAKYLATDMVTITGTVTYRMYGVGDTSTWIVDTTKVHNVFAQLKGDIKVSANATASVYWGSTGYKSVASSDSSNYSKPWGAYFELVSPMYWDTFGASFTVKF
ncbi:MAG: hypothetical protein BWY00_00060 [Firmicutes bacterium ADurb.Bin153]|nr:MAG: hypothetical protein BWY00_00060 [Firmicutes bacterium ADurb.Bin153]